MAHFETGHGCVDPKCKHIVAPRLIGNTIIAVLG